ncbi:hypothetical protein GMI69_01475 [Eggerthellaceae bacterium zg-887]|uniref:N-acetylmuramoyl-L-alanine amidase family protein n=1 Tax=Xiamenia xianingshaonis TaxID=2682776 RepID=UPI00140C4274|nr:N-acetylmuramoyl-L-alanine amidase family protein [Xiamenia xianingshaonis]NHM15346.1 hypothetical protein [Xiamenia xianingshaonis]
MTSGKSIAESVTVSDANGDLESDDGAYTVSVVKEGVAGELAANETIIAEPGKYSVTVAATDNYKLKTGVVGTGTVSVEKAEEYSAKFVTVDTGAADLQASANGTLGTIQWNSDVSALDTAIQAGIKVYPDGSDEALDNSGDAYYEVTYTDENGEALENADKSKLPQVPGEYGVMITMDGQDEPLETNLTVRVVADLGTQVNYAIGNYTAGPTTPINLIWNKNLTTSDERIADVLEQFEALEATLIDAVAGTPAIDNGDLLFEVTTVANSRDGQGVVTVTPASKNGLYSGSYNIKYSYGETLPAFSLSKASGVYNGATGYDIDDILSVPKVKDPTTGASADLAGDQYSTTVTYVDDKGKVQPVADTDHIKDVQEYTITVTGKNKYAGTQTLKFSITPRPVTQSEVSWVGSKLLTYNKDTEGWETSFNGSEITPQPAFNIKLNNTETVTSLDKKPAKPGKDDTWDYEISYENNKNIGTATAAVTFSGNYSGTVDLAFDILPAELKKLEDVSATAQNQLVGSFPEKPTPADVQGVEVTYTNADGEEVTLEQGDYTVESVKRLSTNKNDESVYEFVVKGQGNYTGELKGQFRTVNKDIAELWTAAIEEGDYVYELGEPVLAKVEVKTKPTSTKPATDISTSEGENFKVVCANNTNAGTATATIVGMGDYAGSIELTYEVAPLQISEKSAANITLTQNTYTYEPGIQAQPEINWKTAKITPSNHAEVDLNDLVNDLEITYVDNDKAGTAQAVITGKEGGNVSGSYAVDFTINPADISKATVEAADVTPGAAVEDAVAVKYGETALAAGTDYTVAAEGALPGKVTATVTGTGNYTGTATADVDVLYDVAGLDYQVSSGTYNGQSQTPTITASYKDAAGKTVEVPASALNVAAGSYVNAGKYDIKVTGNNAAGWGGETTVSYTIAPATVTAKPQVSYDAAGLPVVTVPGLTSSDFDYKPDPATKTITVTYKGNYKGTATVPYTPAAKPVTPEQPAAGKTGWVGSGNDWAYYEGGKQVKDQWKFIGGEWYHFEKSGKMTNTKWFQDADGEWYLLNQSHKGSYGAMLTGWQKVDGGWYYMGKSGDMQSGWAKVNGEWYLLNTAHDGTFGKMLTGWQQVGGKWYYMDASGAMAENEWVGRYWVNGSGVWTATR